VSIIAKPLLAIIGVNERINKSRIKLVQLNRYIKKRSASISPHSS
jgi:hypothetical protein